MGIIVSKDNDQNSRLSERINSDLRERLESTSEPVDKDLVSDSEYLKELEKTGRFSWVWFVLIVLAIASLIFIALL